MKIAFQRSRARDVEHDIMVVFERVATVPITVNGRALVAYVGVTKIGALAHTSPAGDIDVADVAAALTTHPPATGEATE